MRRKILILFKQPLLDVGEVVWKNEKVILPCGGHPPGEVIDHTLSENALRHAGKINRRRLLLARPCR